MFYTSHAKNKGFTIMEIMIAISILTFGVLAVYEAFSVVIVSTYNISARFTAAYLAQEGVEIIRNIRDNNFIARDLDPSVEWSSGLVGSPCNSGCMLDYKTVTAGQLTAYDGSVLKLDNDGFYSYPLGGTNTTFQRRIIVSPVPGTSDALHIDATVFWTYNGKSFTFNTSEYIYNWY